MSLLASVLSRTPSLCTTNHVRYSCLGLSKASRSLNFIGSRSFHASLPKLSDETKSSSSFVPEFLSPDRMVAKEGFNRWAAIPPVLAIQGSIGSIYAWSIFNSPLTRELGVIASASADWNLASVVPIFSTTAVCFGCSVWLLGSFMEKIGPRACAFSASVLWGSGLALAGLGTSLHTLPLLYAGYGLLGGLGFAFGYISPVTNMIKWFPDKRGLATGLGVMAFGGGALLCAPLGMQLMKWYSKLPDFIGNLESLTVVTESGKRMVEVNGQLQEVVVGTVEMMKNFPYHGIVENGVYLVGTGDTGLASTFLTLSVGYTCMMMTGALNQRSPWVGFTPFVSSPKETVSKDAKPEVTEKKEVVESYVPLETVMTLPQFKYLWLGVCGNAMAGVAIIACAKTMMGDVFGTQLPMYVDGAFAASYVAGLSLANMSGRLGWATASDFLGRKNVYLAFGVIGLPLCLAIPQLTAAVSLEPSTTHLWMFVATSSALVTCYGGLLGVLPAYIADTFGVKNTTPIFARAMTGWAAAALVGPQLLTYLRGRDYDFALRELATKVDSATFQAKFGGAGLDQLNELIASKTVTISALMEIVPPGTIDPTASIYDSSMYAMAGALGTAFVCNLLMRPVAARHFVKAIAK